MGDLPGLHWLRRQLSGVDGLAGGYQSKMGNEVKSGAGFAMSVVLVGAWLVAVGPMWLWRRATTRC